MEIILHRIKSESPAIATVYLGPSKIAESIIGTKLNVIESNGVFIDRNREATRDKVNNKADNINFLVFVIKKTPFIRVP